MKSADMKAVKNSNFDVSGDPLEIIENKVFEVLKTYSNVHRGSGHYSMITTGLFEHARIIVLEYLQLNPQDFQVVFCSDYGSKLLQSQLSLDDYRKLNSNDIGLAIGVSVLAVSKRRMRQLLPIQTGGNVVRMISADSAIWADAPNKFEAGTSAIVNVIMFAIALIVKNRLRIGKLDVFKNDSLSVNKILYDDELNLCSGFQMLQELKKLQIGYGTVVPTVDGEHVFVNFDHAASTPTFTPVWNVVRMVLRLPETMYTDIIDEVKEIVKKFLNADSDTYETIFTLNSTESINIVSKLIQNEGYNDAGTVIVNTILEHNSNELPWRYGTKVTKIRMSVDNHGFIDVNKLEELLKEYNQKHTYGEKRIRLVAVSGASNVIGTINDIQQICHIAHRYDARVLVDGAQLVAHHPAEVDTWDIDYFAFSGHKIYAPFGTGVLLIKKSFAIDNNYLRVVQKSAEENVIGIAALGKALVLLQRIGMTTIEKAENEITARILSCLSGINGIKVYGIKEYDAESLHKRVGVISFSVEKPLHDRVAKALAEHGGIGTRYGCFCAHLLVKHLFNMGPAQEFILHLFIRLLSKPTGITPLGLVRVSTGIDNDTGDVDRLIKTIQKVSGISGKRLRDSAVEKSIQEKIRQKIDSVYSLS